MYKVVMVMSTQSTAFLSIRLTTRLLLVAQMAVTSPGARIPNRDSNPVRSVLSLSPSAASVTTQVLWFLQVVRTGIKERNPLNKDKMLSSSM
jgi:hypothetical protein